MIQEDMVVAVLLPPLRESGQLEPLAGERGRRASRVPTSLSGLTGDMDGCRIVVEQSGVERDEVASIMDGCSVLMSIV